MKRATPWSKGITSISCAVLMIIALAPINIVVSAPITDPFDKSQLDGIVKNDDWLLVLGRAMFHDQQMGSDGGSCASCHWSGGADNRLTGQMNPAFRAPINGGAGDTVFGCTQGTICDAAADKAITASGGKAGPEYTFVEADYPFRQLADPTDRQSDILINSNDVHSSAGSFDAEFISSFYGEEKCGKANSDIFHKTNRRGHKFAARAVEPRNTPSVINTAMLFTVFWDGRANNLFNGVGVFGMSDIHHDPNKRLIEYEGGQASLTHLEIKGAPLASLSVGPILDNLEMSCDGRTFADVARKILYTTPLAKQRIARTDSTFGIHGPFGDIRNRYKGRGLHGDLRYYQLIKLAFEDKWWKARGLWKIEDGELKKTPKYSDDGYAQMEINFPMFWGLALHRYQSSLISDQSRFDIAEAAQCIDIDTTSDDFKNRCETPDIWTADEQDGRTRFQSFGPGNGGCAACHGGNMFTNAAMDNDGSFDPIQVGFGGGFLVDEGFQNTGANLFAQDVGRFGSDSYGYPLSWVKQLIHEQETGQKPLDPVATQCNIVQPVFGPGPDIKPVSCDANGNYIAGTFDMKNTRITMGGAMKSPSLRNVGLTPPYFHYGGYSNLRDIMDFYARGGSTRRVPEGCTPAVRQGPPGTPPVQPPGTIPCVGDTSGNGPLGHKEFDDIDPNNPGSNVAIGSLNLAGRFPPGTDPAIILAATNRAKDNIVKYMLSLTDDRVRCDEDVFDHPELILFNGAKGRDRNRDGRADDKRVRLPAVGKEGYKYSRPDLCLPNEGNLFAPGMGDRLKEDRPTTKLPLLGGR